MAVEDIHFGNECISDSFLQEYMFSWLGGMDAEEAFDPTFHEPTNQPDSLIETNQALCLTLIPQARSLLRSQNTYESLGNGTTRSASIAEPSTHLQFPTRFLRIRFSRNLRPSRITGLKIPGCSPVCGGVLGCWRVHEFVAG